MFKPSTGVWEEQYNTYRTSRTLAVYHHREQADQLENTRYKLWMLNEDSGQPSMNFEDNKVQNNKENYSVFILPCKSNQNAIYTPHKPCIIFFKIAVDVNYIF